MDILLPVIWSTWAQTQVTQPHVLAWGIGSDYSYCMA